MGRKNKKKHWTNTDVITAPWSQAENYVVFTKPDGQVCHARSYSTASWPVAKQFFKVIDDECIEIPWELAKDALYEREVHGPKPSPCVFNGAKDYLQHLQGLTLHSTDMRWFENHPLAVNEGVPIGHTLRVVQELVEPYGFGIDRVIIRPGYNVPADWNIFMQALGCNPMGIVDLSTDNLAFAKQFGLDPADVDRDFRFEFSETRDLRPCIQCGTGEVSLGHSSYAAPRSPLDKGLQMQYTLARNVDYNVPIVFEQLAVPEKPKVLGIDLSRVKLPNMGGKTVWDLVPKKVHTNFFPPSPEHYTCAICGNKPEDDRRFRRHMCLDCLDLVLGHYACKCGAPLKGGTYKSSRLDPHFQQRTGFSVTCPKCDTFMDINGTIIDGTQEAMYGLYHATSGHGLTNRETAAIRAFLFGIND